MYEKELKIAIQAVKKAEKTFRRYHGTKTKVEMKEGSYLNLVSYADKKIEADTKKFLLKRFPRYGFIGEEYGNTNEKAEYVWAFDPIDGTTNYLQGLPDCAISLALLKKNNPVVGVVSAPFVFRFYSARYHGGATLNGKKITTSNVRKPAKAFGSMGWGRDTEFARKLFPKLLPKIRKMRVPGSVALGLCYVAEGAYDFFIDKSMKIWDYAASQIILSEAGAKLLISKKPKLQIAANPLLTKTFFRLLKKIKKW
jgi:myo-inositol-1(or 4)-monophosphatase